MNLELLATGTARQMEYERLLCACAHMAPEYVLQECGWIQPADFSDRLCRKFWTDLREHGNAERAALDNGMYTDLQEWRVRVDKFTDASEFARKLAGQRWLLQVVGPALAPLGQAIVNGDVTAAWEAAKTLTEKPPTVNANIPHVDETHAKFVASLRGGKRVVKTSTKIDRIIGGLERQTLTILGGWSGTGKTALALQLARNASAAHEQVAFFSLEMSEIGLWTRAALGALRMRPADLKSGQLGEPELQRIERMSDDLRRAYQTLHIYEQAQTTASIWQHVANLRPSLIVVDHLRLLNDTGENETLRLGRMSWQLKLLAKQMDCAVLLLAQLNRTNMAANAKPELYDLRQSGEIAENADIVMMPYRDLSQNVQDARVPAEILFRKHRDGETQHSCAMQYDLLEQYFYDAPDAKNSR